VRSLCFLALILTLNTALADEYKVEQSDCSPTDVRDHHPQLRELFSTPRDQDSIGWCYGFAAADLLSVEAGKPVSASHVSAIFNKSVAKSFLWRIGYGLGNLFMENSFETVYEGGYVDKAIKEAMKESSVCSEDDMPFFKRYPDELYRLIHRIEGIKRSVRDRSLSSEKACESLERVLGDTFFNSQAEKEKLLLLILENDLNIVLSDMMDEQCKDKTIALSKKKIKNYTKPSRVSSRTDRNNSFGPDQDVKKYLKTINGLLDKGKPLGISYNVEHITSYSGLHASVVTARRWNPSLGRCEYKIRNSWGTGCGSYKSDIECDYDEGSFWVSDEKFYKMADTLTAIPN
jgi:hypothetical protein